MLGWVAATGDFGIEAGTLFFSIFWQFPIFGQLVGSYMKIMKRFFYVANRKDKGTALGYFVYGMAYYSSLHFRLLTW
jgi:protoheme IX farnesyltransferase